MKNSNQVVTVLDVDFQVYFSYQKGSTNPLDDPPEPSVVEIEEVILDGWIVTEIISDWTMQQIKSNIVIPDNEFEEK